MKKKILVYSIIVLTLSLLFASIAMAACPPGKVEVTIVNPVGRIMTICVPEQVVDNIGGPGDVVIPAACPCFTQEDVESTLNDNPDMVCEYWDCGDIEEAECYDQNTYDSFFSAWWQIGPSPYCLLKLPAMGCFPGGSGKTGISEDEALACLAILETFVETIWVP